MAKYEPPSKKVEIDAAFLFNLRSFLEQESTKQFLKSSKDIELLKEPPLVMKNHPTIPPMHIPSIPGWICPVCGRGNAPHVSTCSCQPAIAPQITC